MKCLSVSIVSSLLVISSSVFATTADELQSSVQNSMHVLDTSGAYTSTEVAQGAPKALSKLTAKVTEIRNIMRKGSDDKQINANLEFLSSYVIYIQGSDLYSVINALQIDGAKQAPKPLTSYTKNSDGSLDTRIENKVLKMGCKSGSYVNKAGANTIVTDLTKQCIDGDGKLWIPVDMHTFEVKDQGNGLISVRVWGLTRFNKASFITKFIPASKIRNFVKDFETDMLKSMINRLGIGDESIALSGTSYLN